MREPAKLWTALGECGVTRGDSLSLWLASGELVMRKSWRGDLVELQARCELSCTIPYACMCVVHFSFVYFSVVCADCGGAS